MRLELHFVLLAAAIFLIFIVLMYIDYKLHRIAMNKSIGAAESCEDICEYIVSDERKNRFKFLGSIRLWLNRKST